MPAFRFPRRRLDEVGGMDDGKNETEDGCGPPEEGCTNGLFSFSECKCEVRVRGETGER